MRSLNCFNQGLQSAEKSVMKLCVFALTFIATFLIFSSFASAQTCMDGVKSEELLVELARSGPPGVGVESMASPILVCPPVLKSMASAQLRTSLDLAASRCKSNAEAADAICLEQTSPYIKYGTAAAGALLPMLEGSSGKQACEKSNDLMKLLSGALAGYNATCGGYRLACNNRCANLTVAYEKAIADLKAALPPLEKIVATGMDTGVAKAEIKAITADIAELQPAVMRSQARKAKCDDYYIQLGAAGLGLTKIISQLMTTHKGCEQKQANSDCRLNPTDPVCVAAAEVDCSKPENKSKEKCICLNNPALPGCGSYKMGSSGASFSSSSGGRTATGTDSAGSGIGSMGTTITTDNTAMKHFGTAAAKTNQKGVDGGGGGGVGLPMGGKGSPAKTAGKGSGYNTNILSGSEGGGGGGGGGGGYGSSSSYSDYAARMAAYAPNGKNDPGRVPSNVAAMTAAGITVGSGKSNFEKINSTYLIKASSLVRDGGR